MEQKKTILLLLISTCILSCAQDKTSSVKDADTIIMDFPKGYLNTDPSAIIQTDTAVHYSKKKLVGRNHIVLLPDSIADIIESLGFCQKDTIIKYSGEGTVYNYCDICCFKIFPLHKQWKNLFLLEIRHNGTGSGGNHYYVMKKKQKDYQQVNFFMGYIDTVYSRQPYYDIIFKTFDQLGIADSSYRQYYTMQLRWTGKKYTLKKIVEIYNAYRDSTVVLKKYDPEFDDPKHWGSLE